MTALLETSVLVRYLTGDSPSMAERARRIVESGDYLLLTDLIIAETAHVLHSVYRVPREVIVDRLMRLVQRRNVAMVGSEKSLVLQALELCRPSGRVSFPDALTWAVAHFSGARTVYSFDQRFPSEGIQVLRGAP